MRTTVFWRRVKKIKGFKCILQKVQRINKKVHVLTVLNNKNK